MAILDYAYREVVISTLGAGGVGVNDNFSNGSLAKAIIEFCTAPECGMKQIKYATSFDFVVSQDRIVVGEDVEESVPMTRQAAPTPNQAFLYNASFPKRRFMLGEYVNVVSSDNPGVLPTGVTAIASVAKTYSGATDTDSFSVPCISGGAVTLTATISTAVKRKVFGLQSGAVTYIFSVPDDEAALQLNPHKLTLAYKMLDTPYSPGSSRATNTIFPQESAVRASPSTPTAIPCESVANFLTRLSKVHCFKCKGSFFFFVEKSDGSFVSFMFGKGDVRGSYVGGETTSATFFDARYMHKPAPSVYHASMFNTFCSAINPGFVVNPFTYNNSILNAGYCTFLSRWATTKFRCLYPASRKGAKEVVSNPPNARWAMAGHAGQGRDGPVVVGTLAMEWFTAVGSGTPISSASADGYVPAWVQSFGGLSGHIVNGGGNNLNSAGPIRSADPQTDTDPSGAVGNLLFCGDNAEGVGLPMGSGTATGRDDAGSAGFARHALFSSLGQNACSPNGWNNRVPGHEIELFVKEYRLDEEEGVARYLDALTVPGLRVGNVRGFAAKEIVNSDWMAFPVSKFVPSLANNFDSSSYPACYGLGYFVKKGVTI